MSDTLKKELALRFKQFIKSEFKNQQEAANLLTGGQQAVISKMSNGNYLIDNETIYTLHVEKLLNINWFYTGNGDMKLEQHTKPDLIDIARRAIMLNESLEQRVEFLYKTVIDLEERLSGKQG